MGDRYNQNALLFKALADTNRLMIVDMLSCGELCACEILEGLGITQSTLSHHMKILCECGLVNSRKDGKWTHYSLNENGTQALREFLSLITTNKEKCICNETSGGLV